MLGSVREALLAAAFVRDFAAGERPTLFKRLAGEPVVTSDAACEPGRRAVRFHLYTPGRRSPRPRAALLVAHGFTHQGSDDPRLQALCRRLARLGWIVMSPEFPHMRRYRLGFDDTDDLQTALAALALRPEVDPSRIGLMAFSFGAAPVLIGLTREAIRLRTRFALVFGGYFDLRRTLKFVLTGAYDCEGHRGWNALPNANDDRWKFLKGNLHLLPSSASRSEYLSALDARLADPGWPVDVESFAEPERALFRLMGNRDPERFDSLYAEAAPYVDDWVRLMSPSGCAEEIRTPLVIVHSMTDPKCHFSESLAMSRGVPNAPPAQVAIMNTFAHVDLRLDWRSLRAIRESILPGIGRLWAVGRRLVREGSDDVQTIAPRDRWVTAAEKRIERTGPAA